MLTPEHLLAGQGTLILQYIVSSLILFMLAVVMYV